MPRISELPALAQATSGDVIPIVDDSGNITKKVTANKIVPDGSVVTNQLANNAVTTAKIDTATFIQAERRFPGANTSSGYSVAALGSAISGSTYGSGIFTVATDGSITIAKKCIITITWGAYINGTGSAGFMWIINKNSTSIDTNYQTGMGYSGTTDFRYGSVTLSLLAVPGDVFRVGYYKSVATDTNTTRDGLSVSAIAVN